MIHYRDAERLVRENAGEVELLLNFEIETASAPT